jgi:dTDP-4-dehydrorhamnose 3,5-epimerase
MIFTETKLKGAYIIDIERLEDDRGFFARSWCEREFAEHGLETRLVQCNISHNTAKNTLRGMHYQLPPFAEAKLIRCTRGSIYDVLLDLRRNSPSFLQWVAAELNEQNHRMLYVPRGFAHGFLTLTDNTEIFYQMTEFYSPEHARGVRWNDPLFGIDWPRAVRVLSSKDAGYEDSSPDNFPVFPVES